MIGNYCVCPKLLFIFSFSSVQLLSHVRLLVTPWTAARQASLSITSSQSPPKPMSIESVMPSSHLIPCHPCLLLPSIFHSIRVFSSESALHIRWPKYWSFSVVSVAIYIHSNNFYIHTLAQMYLWSSRPIYPTVLLLLLLSRFSRVRLCVTP